ncbi:hypothetical protein L916_16154 [Phytophthora nicotianae]|uniref:Uncharacterized protein n=1 Tax=Phytophthora nicotianae TaxID=4792 RepID=W2I9K8_PHYNI|nr:hypothetical protein L916_16154 [Phytophthora nicotianae]
MGTIGMAFVEIFLRLGKAGLIMRTVRCREANLLAVRKTKLAIIPHPVLTIEGSSPSPVRVDFELWRRRLHAYHIAEINADTYAEYIAIGCSASILFFFGDHPYYSLLRQPDTVNHRSTQLKMLLFQVVVEMVVDFVSSLLEMMAGIEFELMKNLGPFLMVLFMTTAVLNINISVGIYLF